MGTALAQVIAANGHDVRLWSIETDVLQEVKSRRCNTRYLPGIALHERIEPIWEIGQCVEGASLVVLSVPSQVIRQVASHLCDCLRPGQVVLNVAKGVEAGTHKRMSVVLLEELGQAPEGEVGSLGGPAIAVEMARGVPTAIVAGVPDGDVCRRCQAILQNEHVKVQTTTDLCGLELCSTLKNVYAIALGMCDGLGHGTNTKAFVATQAAEEMCEIVTRLGGRRETVFGLAGLGDLLTTGYSPHSRNRMLGEKLGADSGWQEFMRSNTVEGVAACGAVAELVGKQHLSTPLLGAVHQVLFQEQPAADVMARFFRDFSYA